MVSGGSWFLPGEFYRPVLKSREELRRAPVRRQHESPLTVLGCDSELQAPDWVLGSAWVPDVCSLTGTELPVHWGLSLPAGSAKPQEVRSGKSHTLLTQFSCKIHTIPSIVNLHPKACSQGVAPAPLQQCSSPSVPLNLGRDSQGPRGISCESSNRTQLLNALFCLPRMCPASRSSAPPVPPDPGVLLGSKPQVMRAMALGANVSGRSGPGRQPEFPCLHPSAETWHRHLFVFSGGTTLNAAK